jgi:hypothetical protein
VQVAQVDLAPVDRRRGERQALGAFPAADLGLRGRVE